MILLSIPLKFDPRGNIVSILFSRNCNSHSQNSQFNKFEKNLSSSSVDDERPYYFHRSQRLPNHVRFKHLLKRHRLLLLKTGIHVAPTHLQVMLSFVNILRN